MKKPPVVEAAYDSVFVAIKVVQWKSVPLHFGHGGMVSESSSRTTTVPHLVQVYVPFPGFSPVVGMFTPLFFFSLYQFSWLFVSSSDM